jgi:hypothetical protein
LPLSLCQPPSPGRLTNPSEHDDSIRLQLSGHLADGNKAHRKCLLFGFLLAYEFAFDPYQRY